MNFFIHMTPQQIYEELTGGPGSGTIYDAQDISHKQSDLEKDRAEKIAQLAKKIQGGWQGNSADRAYGAATPLALAAMGGAAHLFQAQDLLDRQGGSFERAANSVVPMPEKRPEATIFDEMVPFETDTEKQVKQYQADAQHNLQVFEGYDNASMYNETNMPQEYKTTNHSGGTMTVTPGDTIDSDDYRPTGGDTGGPGNYSAPGGGDSGGARYPGGSTGGPSTGGSPGGPLPGGAPGSQTSPSEYRPAPAPSYPPGGGYPQSPAAQLPGAVPPGGFVPGTTGGYPGGMGGGPGSGGGSGSGGRGGGTGGGVGGGPGARPPGPGGAAGALAAEEAAARRGAVGGAAAGGRGGAGAMGAPMGAGRGRDEDEEHQRKVLIEPDPEDTFGSDVLTAPQVIGDDEYED